MPSDFRFDDESVPLHIRRDECIRQLVNALKLCRQRGLAMCDAEAAYYTAKAEAVYDLKESRMPATLIALVIKGVKSVVGKLRDFHAAEVEYKNAQEAVNVYKLVLRSFEAEIEREWNQAKRM